MNYKYHLLKYHGKTSKLSCPNCGRPHCFVPYVDDDEQIVGEEYGRCDHESSCGYIKYPPSDYDPMRRYRNNNYNYRPTSTSRNMQKKTSGAPVAAKTQTKPQQPEVICTIPMEIVLQTVRTTPLSTFLQFLLSILTVEQIIHIVQEYYIGVTKKREAVFYEIDMQGRCRSGKIIDFDIESGHRIKDESLGIPVNWVHPKLKSKGLLPVDWNLTQCLFGEHLLKLYPGKIVGLVESEKTAVICAALVPDCVWLATGGKGQLNDRVKVLAGRRIISFPDVDGYEVWVKKAEDYKQLGIIVSDLLEKNATQEDRDAHIDIADLLIRWRQTQPGYVPPILNEPPPEPIVSTNPVFLEVQKYFAPEHQANVLKWIEEFDLEFRGVTKIIPTE